jgi:hypothetical protein
VTLKDLEAGEYNLVFRFAGINAGADDSQKLTLPVHVRHHPLWPVLLLIAASVVSFLANKVVAARRRRFELMEKIGGLRPPWLASFAQTLPVVWVRAMLSQAEKLSKRFWLTSPDVIETRVNGVRNVLKVLDEARRLRERLSGALDFLVARRVIPSLERTIDRVGAGTLDDQAMSKMQTEVAAFEDWLNMEKFAAVFWSNIQPSLLRLQSAIRENSAEVPNLKLFADLNTDLDTVLTTPPSKPAEVERAYRTYARLSILWDERHDKATLAECVKKASDLVQLFDVTDRRTWERLKQTKLEIQTPVNSDPGGFEAFAPLQFSVTTPSSRDDQRYIFNYRIQYRWKFILTPAHRGYQLTTLKEMTLEPVTLGPSVMQYFPHAGQVVVSVVLEFLGEQHPVKESKSLAIERSTDFSVMKGFEGAELVSWGIALVIAIASGLSIYYVGAAGWGTFKDYLTLFLWGAGVEQGKNFLQSAIAPK